MMFVWNPRRVSSCWLLGLALAGVLVMLWPLALSAQTLTVDGRVPLVPSPAATLTAREKQWLTNDEAWLKAQPATLQGLQGLPEAPLDSLSLARLSRMLGARADTNQVWRPATSLIRDRWLDRGYLQAQVTDRSGPEGRQLVVTPGPRFRFRRFEVAGPDFPGRTQLLDLWLPRPGTPFSGEDLQLGIDRVLAGAGEAGFPFARWVTSQVSLDPTQAVVDLDATLLPGQYSLLGSVTSDLPPGRPARFLARASGLEPGRPYRESDLERAVQKLLARDLYAQVGIPRVYPTSSVDTVGIHFPVVPKRKVNRLAVVLGLSQRQEDTPSRLSGEVDLRLPNLAGSGRNLGVNWRDDGNGKSRVAFDYLEPLAFGTTLDMTLALDSEVQEDSYTRFRLDNRWQLSVVALWGVELGVGWDRSTYPTGALENSSRTRARGAFLHRRGDRTKSGWSASFAIETAWRSSTYRPDPEDDQLSGNQLGEALTQRIYEIDTDGEIWLGRTWSLAGRVAFRQLDSNEEVVPLGEQFRFGGAASVRGHREDEYHGSEAAYGAVELRIGPPLGSRLYTFYDLGYFGFSTREVDPSGLERLVEKKGWPRGYGLGLLARTPGGDISLAIGFPGTVDFDLAKLHVTLLESF